VLLTAELAPGVLAMSGVILGLVLLALGLGGWIDRLGRLVPQSVLAGLQLGLGTALALLSLELIGTAPLIGVTTLLLVLLLLRRPTWPAALLGLGVAVALGLWLGGDGPALATLAGSDTAATRLPDLVLAFDAAALRDAFSLLVLPQLALTLTNAILLTALVAGDYFGERARHVTPRRLAVTTGLANLALAPLGALPMCHGAGGLAAHHRFGARSGGAPLLLGLTLATVALVPGGLILLAMVPLAGLGALLLIAALELAFSRRLVDCRPSCWPVIGITAALTLWADPFWGLLAGSLAELLRQRILRWWRVDPRSR
jgi:MFS superfamily sulfate permease-like transporter